MITANQAILAMTSLSAVFDPDGMEVTVIRVHGSFPSVVACGHDEIRRVFRFDELTPSREILKLEQLQGKGD